MPAYTVKKIDDMEAIYGGAFKRARAEMGVEAFGLAVMDLPPNLEQYPEHDHSEDGQEEVYVTLAGRGEIEIDGERHPLEPETIVMVGPGVKRKVRTGDEPLRLLAIGGVPGKPYAAPDITQLGVPDPMQQSN
jgi:mannose-6-phosphate isomerase-like protein (cupin superfamily)